MVRILHNAMRNAVQPRWHCARRRCPLNIRVPRFSLRLQCDIGTCDGVCTAEKKMSLGKDWHAMCLKCKKCNKVLTPGQHAEVKFHTPVSYICRTKWGSGSVRSSHQTVSGASKNYFLFHFRHKSKVFRP